MVDKIYGNNFPKQGEWLNKPCVVTYHYDMEKVYSGTIIRDDIESPGNGHPLMTIIMLNDKRVVLSTECIYRVIL